MSVLIIYSCVYISILTELNTEIVGFLTFICLSMASIATITWFMMAKISKSNEIKTKLLLTEQREQLYKEDILHTNEQIENMSKTKHDIKNNILCLSRLIADSKYEEAEEFLEECMAVVVKNIKEVKEYLPLLRKISKPLDRGFLYDDTIYRLEDVKRRDLEDAANK